jgi:predicted metal-dependent hydrolase
VPVYFTYFTPGFHPNDRDTRELLARWTDELFGARGHLRQRLRLLS